VYVSADHQRRGIGRSLLAAVVTVARRLGSAVVVDRALAKQIARIEAAAGLQMAQERVGTPGPNS
jgi:GNAT superfamily N-acetyltransferase